MLCCSSLESAPRRAAAQTTKQSNFTKERKRVFGTAHQMVPNHVSTIVFPATTPKVMKYKYLIICVEKGKN